MLDRPQGRPDNLYIRGGGTMSYNTHWIEKYMGITRKTLLTYEDKGFVKPHRNPDTNFREYSDEELMRIWQIKLLVELKYSFKEIIELQQAEDFSIRDSIDKKIKKLEREKERIEQLIGIARMIKITGRIPTIKTDKLGEEVFEDFFQFVKASWNVNADPKLSEYATLVENLSEKPQEEWTEEEVLQFMDYMDDAQLDIGFTMHQYCMDILENRLLGVSDISVQGSVKQLYDYLRIKFTEYGAEFTPERFYDLIGNSFIDGSSALMMEQQYGKEGCQFIFEAIEYFARHNETAEKQ